MKIKFQLIFIIGLTFLIFICCAKAKSPEKTEWQGTVSEENGIKVIKNPAVPLYGELILDLEQDLSIGNEEDQNYIFYEAGPIAVNESGDIYVLDRGNHRIQKFDHTGAFLQTIGKKGQGPGEFERVYSLFVDKENNIYVSESMRIQKFDSQGKFKKIYTLSARVTDFYVAPDGSIFGNALKTGEEGRKHSLIKIDVEGNEQTTVAEFAGVKPAEREGQGRRMRFAVNHGYNYFLYLASAEKLIYTYSADYHLFQLGSLGAPDLIIKKDSPFLPISRKEKDEVIKDIKERISQMGQTWPEGVLEEACQFPEHRPFLSGLILDDSGRIFGYKSRSSLEESDNREYDIFSPEGYYLYTTTLTFRPSVIKNGYIYQLKEDEETGDIRILRYRVKNWDSIKSGHL